MEGLSLRALARDLGVSHAAPRRHFPDRNALLAELAKAGFRASVEVMNAGAEAAGPDPVARYRALGRAYVRFALEQRALFLTLNHPEVRAMRDDALRAAQGEWFRTLREGAEAAQRAGWHPDADTEALIAFSIAGAMGTATLLADPSWHQVLALSDVDALADDVLDLVVHRSRTTALPDGAPSEATAEPAVGDGTSRNRRVS